MIVGTRVRVLAALFPEYKGVGVVRQLPLVPHPRSLIRVDFPNTRYGFFERDELVVLSPLELLAEVADATNIGE